MKKNGHFISGFTMVEIMVSTVILTIAMVAAMSGWLYVFRGERMNSIQNELDMDVRSAMERIRADMRLSALDKMYFYPSGPGPYTGISLPLARDDNGDGLIERDASGNIIWDKTVVYHVWSGTPNELRKTTFDPRNNARTPAELQAQLDSVVTTGNGSATYDSATAITKPLFQNLFTWEIRGKGAQYDGYRPDLGRDLDVVFGSIVLTPGSHTLMFRTVGKNTLSTGYKIGIDSIVMSPCGVPREAEAQTVSASVGATAVAEFMPGFAWDNAYQLAFPATATQQSFSLTMDNDRWEETTFQGSGSACDDTRVDFDTTYSPMDYVVRLVPPVTNWYAADQTLDSAGTLTGNDDLMGNCAVRVLLRGRNMTSGNGLDNSGPMHCLWFYAGNDHPLKIASAFIAEGASASNITPNAKDTGIQLYFGGSTGTTISAGSSANATNSTYFYIEQDKSYVVSYLVVGATNGANAKRWLQCNVNPSNPTPPGCYFMPGSANPTITDTRATNWSSDPDVRTSAYLYAVDRVHCLSPSNGTWTSQIVDTHAAAPAYSTLTWNSDVPSGTTLTMKLRTSSDPDMIGATDWSAISAMAAGGTITPSNLRYVQVQAQMLSDTTRKLVPTLKDFTVKWTGETKVVDVGGTITQSPSNGVFEILLDNTNIVKRGITIDLTIFQWVRGFSPGPVGSNILTSTVTAEIEPRNSGK